MKSASSAVQVEKPEPESTKPTEQPKEAAKAATIERWISARFAEHTIIVGAEGMVVKFKDYGIAFDLSDPAQKKLSEGLHRSGREGRDIFVVGGPYPENDIGNRSEQMAKLREMNVRQLRSLFTLDELIDAGIPANTMDANDLITLALRTKSIK